MSHGAITAAALKISKTIDQVLIAVEQLSMVAACATLFAIMVLVFLDGTLRYTINRPLTFTADVVNLYLISAAFLAVLSYTLRHGGHICVDLFAKTLPARLYNGLIGTSLLLSAGMIGIMTYVVTDLSLESWRAGELTVGLFAFPVWVSKAIVAVSLALLLARTTHLGLINLAAGVTGIQSFAIAISHPEDDFEEEAV